MALALDPTSAHSSMGLILLSHTVEQRNPIFTWGGGPVWNEPILPGLSPRRASSTS